MSPLIDDGPNRGWRYLGAHENRMMEGGEASF